MDNLDAIALESQGAAPGAVEPGAAAAPAAQLITAEEHALRIAKEWGMLPKIFGGILIRALPELKDVYSEENCLEWGKAMVPIAEKYGWNVSTAMPWMGLAMCSWNIAAPTVDAIKARRAAAAKPAEPKPADNVPAT